MFSKNFWIDATERAIKTAAQFGLVALGGNFVDAWSMDARAFAGAVVAGGLVSVLTSLVSSGIGPKGSASLVLEEGTTEEP